jgi:uncharacterized membrane protein
MKNITFLLLIIFLFSPIKSLTIDILYRLLPSKYFNNPYRILKVSPLSTIHEIKKVYQKKIRETHPDKVKGKTEEFEAIQTAYESIKKERKDYPENERKTIKGIIIESIQDSFKLEMYFMIIYYIIYILFQFQNLIFNPLLFYLISNTIISNLFTHLFDDNSQQSSFVLLFSFLLIFIAQIIKKYFKKFKEKLN